MNLLFIQNEDGTQEVAQEAAQEVEAAQTIENFTEQPAPQTEEVAVAAEAPAQGGWSFWLMIIAMIAIMYFFMWRPESKRRKQMEEFRNNLQKGQKVMTACGIYGTVKDIHPTFLDIEIANNVTIRIDKNMVVGVSEVNTSK